MQQEVLLNGRIVPYHEAVVSIDDRGFQFGEGVYEVIRVYRGKPFELERHMRRLRESAAAVELGADSALVGLEAQCLEMVRRSGLQEAAIYIQVTSGAHPRVHLRPQGLTPTVVITVRPASPPPDETRREGIKVITVPDDRWARCYVKTTQLLPNAAARRRAAAAGCDDAIFVRDGFAMEGSASNLFAVFDGVLTTPPASNYILHGVTRAVVLELAQEVGLPKAERPIPADRLRYAEELFLTGTVSELTPVVAVDGAQIGAGRPGPVFARLNEAFQNRVATF